MPSVSVLFSEIWVDSSSMNTGRKICPVLTGSGIKRAFDPLGDGATSGGVRGRDCSEEFVDVSQQPEEHRDEISPSYALSREEDREDLPEEPPLDEPSREEPGPLTCPTGPLTLMRLILPRPTLAGLSREGDTPAVTPPLIRGEVRTEPSGC
mmetsp:Transcript_9570/g.17481  ORF Transcript_9570/g.17481 Transcript_9570/m.17481 type:complete len:152 (+) Transcript_9570:475-930(+)